MKTIQVIRRFAFDEWGGTETVVWNTACKLAEKNHKNEIVATKALASNPSENINNVTIKRFDYLYPYLNLTPENKLALDKKGGNPYSLSLFRYLLKSEKVEILHCHTMQRIANTVRLAARHKKIPYVISFHGGCFDVPQSEIQEMMKPLKNTFNYGKIFDIILKNNHYLQDASGIICVGYNEYLITKEKYPDKVVTYLPNGVDIDKFNKTTDNDFRQKYHIPQEDKIILCVSRIDYQKNQGMLIELLNLLIQKKENVHLVIIGPVTSENYFQKLLKKIKEYNLDKHITIIKGLEPTDPDLVNSYKSANYFILPSVHEPFGIVALEAWASQLPVIAARVGGLQKLITDNKTGLLFQPDSLTELSEKFYQLKQDNSLRDNLINNSFNEVNQKYSWDTITDKLIDFYQEVISKYQQR